MKYTPQEPLTLLEALTYISPNSSKTTLRDWLKDERVTVDGRVQKLGHFSVLPGQVVAVGARTPRLVEGKLRILYEDDDIVVVDKPVNLLSVATAFEKKETVFALLKQKYRNRKVYVIHRLDEETSGVMIFAFSEKAFEGLKALFEKHEIDRQYCAVVEGMLTPKTGTWTSYLYEDSNYVVHQTQDPTKGKIAVTHYQVQKATKHYSLVDVKLETGRKNQIRVHCQLSGHPVVGDLKYGGTSNPLKRLCLHAYLLGFVHPITQKAMRFESPIPVSFHELLNRRTSGHA